MNRFLVKCLSLLLAFLGAGAAASAHTKSESYASYELTASVVRLTYSVAETEAVRLATPGPRSLSDEDLGGYLAQHLSVTAGGRLLPVEIRPLAASPGFQRFELVFKRTDTQPLALRSSVFFDVVPSHVVFARIRTEQGEFIEQLFTSERREFALAGEGEGTLQSASFGRYLWLGIEHILTGPDHIAFLIGLLLLSRTFRDLAFVVTGFTFGHSVTLALAVSGVVRPHAEFIDVLIALTIAMVGVENIAVVSGRSRALAISVGASLLMLAALKLAGLGHVPALLLLGAGIFSASYLLASGQLHDAARLHLVVTLVFGLVHGFAFAGDLIEMHLPTGRMVELLFGFNLGVEAGQLTLVTVVSAFVWLVRRTRFAPPRIFVVDGLSAALAGLGVFWIVTRTYA